MLCGLATKGEFGAANDGLPAGAPLPSPTAVGRGRVKTLFLEEISMVYRLK